MSTLVLSPAILVVNLVLKQGTDTTITLTTVDASGAAIINPTGYIARAQIRSNPTGLVLFEWNSAPSSGQGLATLTYSNTTLLSTTTLTLTAAQSALFTFSIGEWDCFLTSPSGQSACLAEGTVAVDPYVTH
ncbi:MAG: hypothetical protein ACREQ5_00570 [Candidatus Dormibacteria bacterium]